MSGEQSDVKPVTRIQGSIAMFLLGCLLLQAAGFGCGRKPNPIQNDRGSTQIVFEKSGTRYYERCVLIDERDFSVERVADASKDFLEGSLRATALKKLVIGIRVDDLSEQTGGKGFNLITCAGWEMLRRKVFGDRKPGPIAEMVAIGGDAVLRWRDGSGDTGRVVLRGTDPLKIRIGASVLGEIVHITAVTNPMEDETVEGDEYYLTYYVVTAGQVTSALARRIAERLSDEMVARNTTIMLANDAWFVDDGRFPWFYRFANLDQIPTCVDLSSRQQAVCVVTWPNSISCYGP